MQRGAQKRDREPTDTGSDYAGMPPSLRDEDRAHLGLSAEAFDKFAASLEPKVIGYARAGFRKPADVTRLLNREKIKTLSGSDWNPRLVYFLLSRIYGDRPRVEREVEVRKPKLPDQNRFEAVRRAIRKRDHLEALPPVVAATPQEEKVPKERVPLEKLPKEKVKKTEVAARHEQPPRTKTTPEKEKPPRLIKVRAPSDPVPLSADEMARRVLALQAFHAIR
jgi:hypothetical protein